MLLKIILAVALGCFATLFWGGFLNAEPTEIAKKLLFGGASAVMILIAFGIMFVDRQQEKRRTNMPTRTERADEIFWTVILFVITAVCYFLGHLFLLSSKPGFGYPIMTFALAGTIGTIFGIKTILVHRFAEQRMREIEKEKEKNR